MQQNRFDIHSAPQIPLRAEPRNPRQHAQASGHIHHVEATSGGLLRSSLKAAGVAVALLTVFYLPSEYGVDPTGLGGVLGLTEMGQIKQQLYAEAEAETAAPVGAAPAAADPALIGRLDRIEAQVAVIAAVVGAAGLAAPDPAPEAAAAVPEAPAAEPVAEPVAEAAPEPAIEAAVAEAAVATPVWRDEVNYTLAPGEGIEVKLAMQEGQVATFEWTANGGVLNHATHGDGGGEEISYEDGRGVPEQAGKLTAAFTGNHGWFWRNRTEEPVKVTLRTAGDYAEMKAP
ncbi:hypothetical protein [Tabrizicola sp.]|uniref:hypothetical protein n=1 Tax=Tabrizicola sp. TaxID=2005166 RepID=UPI0035B4FA42